MAKSSDRHLERVRLAKLDAGKAARALATAERRLTRAMIRARMEGHSLRAIAGAAAVSDVTVLNRTRDYDPSTA